MFSEIWVQSNKQDTYRRIQIASGGKTKTTCMSTMLVTDWSDRDYGRVKWNSTDSAQGHDAIIQGDSYCLLSDSNWKLHSKRSVHRVHMLYFIKDSMCCWTTEHSDLS